MTLHQTETVAVTVARDDDRHRPECEKCHLEMRLFGREKRLLKPGTIDHRTYVCEICGIAQER